MMSFRVTVVGDRAENVTTLVRQVAYLNTREFPAPGKRLVHLTTTLHCKSGKTIHLVTGRTATTNIALMGIF